MTNTNDWKDTAASQDGEMSLREKEICMIMVGKQPKLSFPLKELVCADGTEQLVYEIPEAQKEAVYDELWSYVPKPKIDDVMYDLHEEKVFKVRDFIVIRWRGCNLIASPYFAHSGGMMIDFVELAQCEEPVMPETENAQQQATDNGENRSNLAKQL